MQKKSIQNTSQDQLDLGMSAKSQEKKSEKLTSLLSDFRARICQLLESGKGLKVAEAVYSMKRQGLFVNCIPDFSSLKMLQDCFQNHHQETLLINESGFSPFFQKSPTLGYMSVNGKCLTLNGFCPRIESGYTLSDILEEQVAAKYFLSEEALKGLMKGQSKPQLLEHCKEEDIPEDIILE